MIPVSNRDMMRCLHRMREATVLPKTVGLLALLGRTLFGQEGQGIQFDPRETGELPLNWKSLLLGLLLALACCGLWKIVMWFLESIRTAVNWTRVRIWWPTAMLVWGWLLFALFSKTEFWRSALDAVFFVFGTLNFPALLIVGIVMGLFDESVHAPVWARLLAGSLTLWIGDYFLVRLAEWQAWKNVRVSLHLSDPPSQGVKDLRL